MDMPFYFFFGLLGLAVGALVVWLLLADHPFEGPEPPVGPVDKVEATMIAGAMAKRGRPVDEETVVDLIELHTAYLEGRISEELALTAADRIEAARAKAEAEVAQTSTVVATQAAADAVSAAPPMTATPAPLVRGVRTRKSASTARAEPAALSAAPDPAPSAQAALAPPARAARSRKRTVTGSTPTDDTDPGPSEQE
jgi:hypothetical protein